MAAITGERNPDQVHRESRRCIATIDARITRYQQEKAALAKRVQALEGSITEQEGVHAQHAQKCEDQLFAVAQQRDQLSLQKTTLEKQLLSTTAKLAQTCERVQELEKLLKAADTIIGLRSKENEALNHELTQQRDLYHLLSEQLQKLTEQNAAREQQMAQVLARINELEKQQEPLRERVTKPWNPDNIFVKIYQFLFKDCLAPKGVILSSEN